MNSWILEFQEMTQALDGLGDFGSREPGYYYYGVWCFDHAKEILALTEQLRLANEDAERLYAELEFAYDGEDVDTDTALRLHRERITQER